MSRVPLVWVDAFTDHPFAGNPAAVCVLERPADEGWMQALAAELGISETAFVVPRPTPGDYDLRWFTPTTEVDLCGHATLATAHVLGPAAGAASGGAVAFETRSGRLGARVVGDRIELDLPAEPPTTVTDARVPDWAAVLGGSVPVVATHVATATVVAELSDAAAVRAASPDLDAVRALDARVLYLSAPGDDADVDYVLRVFGPAVGIDEDPVTGSAQCVLGPLWSARLGRATLEVLQESSRRGWLTVTVDGDRVRIAGRAVTVVAGEVEVP